MNNLRLILILVFMYQTAGSFETGAPLHTEYLIAVPSELAISTEKLATWREEQGLSVGIANFEQIYSLYLGRDKEEKFRNYLISAFETGLKRCLIIGDETNSPVRIASYGYHPVDIAFCQSDLYFSDLSGEWDRDSNGVWGSFIGDRADPISDIQVGRVPASNTEEVDNFILKLLAYEKGILPSGYRYNSVLSVSVDQFVEQNNDSALSVCLPSGWTLTKLRELPSGDSPSPVFPTSSDIHSQMQMGYGWVTLFAHGRTDGITINSAGYGNFPKTNVFTQPDLGGPLVNQTFNSIFPAVYISASCDHGDFSSSCCGESMAENLLFSIEGGAIVFMAHSTKGWINRSPKIVEAVYNEIPEAKNMGDIHLAGRELLKTERMLFMSFNLYGDPQTPIWKSDPVIYTSVLEEESEIERTEDMIAYPNPSNGSVTIVTNQPITVFNILGQEVLRKQPVDGKLQISNLRSGVFFAQEDITKRTKKIVIVR